MHVFAFACRLWTQFGFDDLRQVWVACNRWPNLLFPPMLSPCLSLVWTSTHLQHSRYLHRWVRGSKITHTVTLFSQLLSILHKRISFLSTRNCTWFVPSLWIINASPSILFTPASVVAYRKYTQLYALSSRKNGQAINLVESARQKQWRDKWQQENRLLFIAVHEMLRWLTRK